MTPFGGRRTRALLLVPILATTTSLLVSCGGPDPDPAADKLAAGLGKLDLTKVPLDTHSRAVARDQLTSITSSMGGLKPKVTVTKVSKDGSKATASLAYVWNLADGVDWRYRTSAELALVDKTWKVVWAPKIVAPKLTDDQRLVLSTTPPARGNITGAGGQTIVKPRPVVRVGIDKSTVDAGKAADSGRRLAKLIGIDPAQFAARIEEAGAKAFVEGIVLRAGSDVPLAAIKEIPGALTVDSTLPLAPSRTFAAPILGTVGDATADLIKKSDGRLKTGDTTGLSGLQLRYDTQLRGTDGFAVRAESTTDDSVEPSTLFSRPATPGKPLATTLDPALQTVAEKALASTKPASALVAIRPSTGDVLAAASGPGGKGQSTATVGRYAPGSTFKVISSLAMLRNGYKITDKVPCTPTITINGKRFKNYDDYPKSKLGTITMRTAIANSCNTAVISAHSKVPQADLARAAASLGLGVDHDLGFPVFLGSVPTQAETTEHAASMIGQGKVEASPVAMATVAASVAAGKTVVPRLLPAQKAAPVASTLTAAESTRLRQLMRAVVTEGSGAALRSLPGPPVGAKTGTAEYGTDTPPRTHAWMIATQGDLAVAVFVDDGQTGSGTAGPILKQFLQAARR